MGTGMSGEVKETRIFKGAMAMVRIQKWPLQRGTISLAPMIGGNVLSQLREETSRLTKET